LIKKKRKVFGKEINSLKVTAEARLKELEDRFALKEKKRSRNVMGRYYHAGQPPVIGRSHPITQTFDEIIRIFSSLGFSVAEDPTSRRNITTSKP